MRGYSFLLATLLAVCASAPAHARTKQDTAPAKGAAAKPSPKKHAKAESSAKPASHRLSKADAADASPAKGRKLAKGHKLVEAGAATKAVKVGAKHKREPEAVERPAAVASTPKVHEVASKAAARLTPESTAVPVAKQVQPGEPKVEPVTASTYGPAATQVASQPAADPLKALTPAQMATRMARMAVDMDAVRANAAAKEKTSPVEGWSKE